MKILKFIISIVLTVSIISPNINFAFAEDSNVVFDDYSTLVDHSFRLG